MDRKAGEKRSRKEMPAHIRELPAGLQEAWLAGELIWEGGKFEDQPPVVKTKPGKSIGDLIARGGR